jgi:hypothetical protein
MQTQLHADSAELVTTAEDDQLAEIDLLMYKREDDARRRAEQRAQLVTDRSEFWTEFARVCEDKIRPSMEAIIERLRRNGGGGAIVERPENLTMRHDHRVTLWMSLAGEITGTLRVDRLPYLQLDADVQKRSVVVSEGDMWDGHGGNRSGRTGEWQLSEITPGLVTEEALAILRRSLR